MNDGPTPTGRGGLPKFAGPMNGGYPPTGGGGLPKFASPMNGDSPRTVRGGSPKFAESRPQARRDERHTTPVMDGALRGIISAEAFTSGRTSHHLSHSTKPTGISNAGTGTGS